MTVLRWLCMAALGLTVTACFESNGTDLRSVESGVYEIDGWFYNDQGCDAVGPSIAEQRDPTYVVIGMVDGYDQPFIAVEPCTDLDDCHLLLDATVLGGFPNVRLTAGNQADGFTGRNAGSTATGDICRFWEERSSLTIVDGAAHFERRTHYVERDRDALLCGLSEAPPESRGECRELETLTATRVRDLR